MTSGFKIALGATIAIGLIAPRLSSAQEAVVANIVSDNNFDAEAVTSLEGPGIQMAPGLWMHLSAALKGGASDNVFNQTAAEGTVASGLLSFVPTIYFASDKTTGEDMGDGGGEITPRSVEFRGGLRANYHEYLSGKDYVQGQRSLNLDALVDLVILPGGPVSFLTADRYTRDSRSPNLLDSSTLRRDDNRLQLGISFHPDNSTLSGVISYENWLEVFETGGPSNFANRMNQTISARAEWTWRPVTKFLADVSYGFFGPMGDSQYMGMPFKTNSRPLRASVGIATLLSAQTTLKAHAGYSRAHYEVGKGYSAPLGGVELGYRWAPTGRLLVGYDYDHFDSLQSNFYADHLFQVKAVQSVGNFVLDGGPELRLRHFGGIPMTLGPTERDDIVVAGRVRGQLLFAEKFSVSAEYSLGLVKTDYRAVNPGGGVDDPSFIRNEFFLGVRAGY